MSDNSFIPSSTQPSAQASVGLNQNPPTGHSAQTQDPLTLASLKTITMVAYILFAVSIFTGGLTAIVGLIIAYVKRGETAGTVYQSHFSYLIRTFWYGFGFMVLSILTAAFIVGIFIGIGAAIWYIYRIVKGFLRFNDSKTI